MQLRLILAVLLLAIGGSSGAAQARSEHSLGQTLRPSTVRSADSRAPEEPAEEAASSGLTNDAALAQIGATVVAFLGLFFLGFQIRSQRSDERAGWTLSYQATYNDRAFRTVASKCTGFFDADDAADCVNKIRAIGVATWADDPSLRRTPPTTDAARASTNDLRHVLGFFETRVPRKRPEPRSQADRQRLRDAGRLVLR